MQTINELKEKYYGLLEVIQQRKTVTAVLSVENGYCDETEKLIIQSNILKKQLVSHYEVERLGAGSIETVRNYTERMNLNIVFDELGNEVKAPKYKLGVDVIDKEWLADEGMTKGCFIALGADTGVGKTELCIMFMQSFVRQERKVLFSSLEMGDQQLYDLAFKEGKFDSVLSEEKYMDNLFLSFDTNDIDDLSDAILIAHRDKGIDVFVIDSFLPIETGHSNTVENMKTISKMLDSMKRTLNITVILIAQWSRADSKDGYYDFSGGTSLQYLCDFALFIEKFENSLGKNTMRKLTCSKNRLFPKFVNTSIITDYDYDTKKIVKVCNANTDESAKLEINRDKSGKVIRSFDRR